MKIVHLYRMCKLSVAAMIIAQTQPVCAKLFAGRHLDPELFEQYAQLKASWDITRVAGPDNNTFGVGKQAVQVVSNSVLSN